VTPCLFSRQAKQSWTYNPSDSLSAAPVIHLFVEIEFLVGRVLRECRKYVGEFRGLLALEKKLVRMRYAPASGYGMKKLSFQC
jgi:hypothetical protein